MSDAVRTLRVLFAVDGADAVPQAGAKAEASLKKTEAAAKKTAGETNALGGSFGRLNDAVKGAGDKLDKSIDGIGKVGAVLGKVTFVVGAAVLAYEGLSAAVDFFTSAQERDAAQMERTHRALVLLDKGYEHFADTVKSAVDQSKALFDALRAAGQSEVSRLAGKLGVGVGALSLDDIASARDAGEAEFKRGERRNELAEQYRDTVKEIAEIQGRGFGTPVQNAATLGQMRFAQERLGRIRTEDAGLRQTGGDPFATAKKGKGPKREADPSYLIASDFVDVGSRAAGMLASMLPDQQSAVSTGFNAMREGVLGLGSAVVELGDAFGALDLAGQTALFEQQAATTERLGDMMSSFGQGIAGAAVSSMLFGDSFKKALPAALKSLSVMAGVEALMEVARGIAAQGITWGAPNPSSVLHFTAAGKFAAISGGAAIGYYAAGGTRGDASAASGRPPTTDDFGRRGNTNNGGPSIVQVHIGISRSALHDATYDEAAARGPERGRRALVTSEMAGAR